MIEIKGKTIIYTVPSNNVLGQVSPHLLIEKLEDEIVRIWPQLKVRTVFASRKESSHQIYSVLPIDYTNEQVRLIKVQIELIAASLLADLQKKIYFASLAS